MSVVNLLQQKDLKQQGAHQPKYLYADEVSNDLRNGTPKTVPRDAIALKVGP